MTKHIFTTLVVCGFSAVAADAQLVQLGPHGGVRVNAPFLHLEVGPTGETYVRAPFTRVHAPGRPVYARPNFDRPPWEPVRSVEVPYESDIRSQYRDTPGPRLAPPTSQALSHMSWPDLQRYLRDAATQLDVALQQTSDGAVWRKYLQMESVLNLGLDSDRAHRANEREELGLLLRTFDATKANRQLGRITDLPGFEAVRGALRQMITQATQTSDDARASADSVMPREIAEQLAVAATQLDRELRGFESSAALRGYLELPLATYRGATDAPPDLAELELMLRRYDGVSRAREYEQIAQLDSFRDTRHLLGDYVRWLREQSAGGGQPTPAEPLPSPIPRQ